MEVSAKRLKLEAEAFPLHAAVKRGSLEDVMYFLEKGVAVDEKDLDGFTPFALACRKRSKQIG
jgi:ankyrin repeat protein